MTQADETVLLESRGQVRASDEEGDGTRKTLFGQGVGVVDGQRSLVRLTRRRQAGSRLLLLGQLFHRLHRLLRGSEPRLLGGGKGLQRSRVGLPLPSCTSLDHRDGRERKCKGKGRDRWKG